jgi:hypothetical protein
MVWFRIPPKRGTLGWEGNLLFFGKKKSGERHPPPCFHCLGPCARRLATVRGIFGITRRVEGTFMSSIVREIYHSHRYTVGDYYLMAEAGILNENSRI